MEEKRRRDRTPLKKEKCFMTGASTQHPGKVVKPCRTLLINTQVDLENVQWNKKKDVKLVQVK
jgi:hypothetical protein